MLRDKKAFSRIAAICFLLLSTQAFAGAWTQSKHGYFFKFSANYLYTTREYNYLGDRLAIFQERVVYRNASFQDINLNFYGEYGLTDRATLVASLPIKVLTSKWTELILGGQLTSDVTVTTAGPADLSLSLRYGLLRNPLVISAQAGVKIPTGYRQRPKNDGPPLGTAKFDGDFSLLFGASLYPVPIYFTAGLGYRQRGGPFNDQMLYSAEAGVTAGRVLLKVTFDGLLSTVAPPDIVGQTIVTPLPGGGGVLPNIIVGDQDIHKVSPSIIYTLRPGLALQAEALHMLAGKNTVSGSTFSLGLIFNR